MATHDEAEHEHLRKAVALLTAWDESEDEERELVERIAVSYLEGSADPMEMAQRLSELAVGLLSLSGRLLIELSRHTGKSHRELLEVIGRRAADGT